MAHLQLVARALLLNSQYIFVWNPQWILGGVGVEIIGKSLKSIARISQILYLGVRHCVMLLMLRYI